jgi:ribulose bisphosphate carboxylase small subunit
MKDKKIDALAHKEYKTSLDKMVKLSYCIRDYEQRYISYKAVSPRSLKNKVAVITAQNPNNTVAPL